MGKQIRIHLADGTSSGIKHAEITNWTGQAFACPRARFSELGTWKEVRRPGVYLLFGTVEDTGEDAVYIGESEMVLGRLNSHMAGKEFWAELVAFTNKDDNLTKAHVKYLESRLIRLAIEARRYHVTNKMPSQPSLLPRGDLDAMEEYLQSAAILLGVLGHRVLEPYLHSPRRVGSAVFSAAEAGVATGDIDMEERSAVASPIFELHMNGLDANAIWTDEGIVVRAGSEASATLQNSFQAGYRALRDKLMLAGALVKDDGKLTFTRDQLFNSPSQAAAMIVGYSINGRDAWRLKDGTTYAVYEQRLTSLTAPDDKDV